MLGPLCRAWYGTAFTPSSCAHDRNTLQYWGVGEGPDERPAARLVQHLEVRRQPTAVGRVEED
eukprot:11211707-Lingulodinium_polyedra.AAC.1